MKRILSFVIVLGCTFLLTSHDIDTNKIDRSQLIGGWEMEKVLRPDGTIKNPTVFINVLPDGTFKSVRKGLILSNISGTWKYNNKEQILSIKGSGISEQFEMLELTSKRLTAKRIHTKWRKYFLVRK